MTGFRPTRTELLGFICCLLGFIIHVTDRSTRTVGGVDVTYDYDYATAGFGAVAVLLAMKALAGVQSHAAWPGRVKALHVLTAGVVALIGLYQIASGAGVLRLV